MEVLRPNHYQICPFRPRAGLKKIRFAMVVTGGPVSSSTAWKGKKAGAIWSIVKKFTSITQEAGKEMAFLLLISGPSYILTG